LTVPTPDTIADHNRSFTHEVPGFQVTWDSTSLGALKTCPRRYYYEIIEGRRGHRTNIHLTFGSALHAGAETYARSSSHEEGVREALREALSIFDPPEDPPEHKTTDTLLRSLVWYLDSLENESFQTISIDKKPAVEQTFLFSPDITVADQEIFLAGHIDRIAEDQHGHYWVVDIKTSKNSLTPSFFEGFNPDNQVSLYTIAGKIAFNRPVSGVVIDGIQVNPNWTKLGRAHIPRYDGSLNEWLTDLTHYVELAYKFARDRYWPMNDKACSMYGGCPFRSVCSRSPEFREEFLNGMFTTRVWDPTVAR